MHELQAAHGDVLAAAIEAKTAFEGLQNDVANIGHNRPPEPIDDLLLDDVLLDDVGDAIDTLHRQDAQPEDGGDEAHRALGLLTRVRDWLADKGDRFVNSFVDEMGKRVADTLFLAVISTLILKVTGWLKLLHSILGG